MVSDKKRAMIKTRQAARIIYQLNNPASDKYTQRKFANKMALKTKYGPSTLNKIGYAFKAFFSSDERNILNKSKDARKAYSETMPLHGADANFARIRVYNKNPSIGGLMHEITHISPYSKNEMETASAFSRYLALNGDEGYYKDAIKEITKSTEDVKHLVERGFSNNLVNKTRKILKSGEYSPVIKGRSYSELGQYLGTFASSIDQESGVYGRGLILIREVSRGKPIEEAKKEILSGKYDAELANLIRNNPKIKKEFRRNNLEYRLSAIIGITGLLGSLFFLVSNLTGNMIGISQSTSNFIGIILFLVGLTGAFSYFKKMK